jgi:hypothetical protein
MTAKQLLLLWLRQVKKIHHSKANAYRFSYQIFLFPTATFTNSEAT